MLGGRDHIELAFSVFEGLLEQSQDDPSRDSVQAHPRPISEILGLEEVQEHIGGGWVPEVVAQDLKRSDESPSVWM